MAEPLDVEVWYMEPNQRAQGGTIEVTPKVVMVKHENYRCTDHFVVLQSENGGDLVQVNIPHRLILGLRYFKRDKTAPGYA